MSRRALIGLFQSLTAFVLCTWAPAASGCDAIGPIALTNTLESSLGYSGTLLPGQTICGHEPGQDPVLTEIFLDGPAVIRLGHPNQWRFYSIENTAGFTNAAFAVFPDPGSTNLADLDLDLYVSTDPWLMEFGPAAFNHARKSVSPGPEESISDSDAQPGHYYIAVKCESAVARPFCLAAVFSEAPLHEAGTNNSLILKTVPVPLPIESGAPEHPANTILLAMHPPGFQPRRVVVQAEVSHDNPTNLSLSLSRSGTSLLLTNLSGNSPLTNAVFTFDDSLEADLPGTLRSAGPGTLADFAGATSDKPWLLRVTSYGGTGIVHQASITLFTNATFTGEENPEILPGATRDAFIQIPASATNYILPMTLAAGDGPVTAEFAPVDLSGLSYNFASLSAAQSSAWLAVDSWSNPPISSELWRLRIHNQGTNPASVTLGPVTVETGPEPSLFRVGQTIGIPSFGVTTATLMVTNTGPVESVRAGVRLDHPRLSDLQLYLVNPEGARVLLDCHRGGHSTNGMGHDVIVTNVIPVSSSGGQLSSTNQIDLRRTAGSITIAYDFYGLPDSLKVYYEDQLLLDTGMISGSGTTNISYGPGDDSFLTIVMNEGDNTNPDTAWFYSVTSVVPDFALFWFEDHALPIKFAPDPFDADPVSSGEIIRAPEQLLSSFSGGPSSGNWALEIHDTKPGPGGALLREFVLAVDSRREFPLPKVLQDNASVTNTLAPGQVQWFAVSLPAWNQSLQTELSASGPLQYVYGLAPQPWEASGALTNLLLSANCSHCVTVLDTSTIPPILPGSTRYLGLVNTNDVAVQYTFNANLTPDVATLGNQNSLSGETSAGAQDYYLFTVSERANRVRFELTDLTGDMKLLVKKGLPLPDAQNADIISDNPGMEPEVVDLWRDRGSVLLSPGSWFLCASNASAGPVSYRVTARAWARTGAPLLITSQAALDGEFCLSWTTLPGMTYYVEATTDPLTVPWTIISGPIISGNDFASFCIPIASPTQLFRVREAPP